MGVTRTAVAVRDVSETQGWGSGAFLKNKANQILASADSVGPEEILVDGPPLPFLDQLKIQPNVGY